MTPRLLTTQEAAERLGLTPGSLQELRWKDDGLPIFQNGLSDEDAFIMSLAENIARRG